MSALIKAIKANNVGAALKLLTDEAIRAAVAADNRNEALGSAAFHGQLKVVQELLKIEAVYNNAAAQGNEALRVAAQKGYLPIVQELLKIEAVWNNVAAGNNSVLWWAASGHSWEVVQELLKIEAVRNNVAARDDILSTAASNGILQVVQELLKIEAVRKNAAIKNNKALLWAAYKGHLLVVQELLKLPVVVNAIGDEKHFEHVVLRGTAQKHTSANKTDKFLIVYYLIEIYKKKKIALPEDIMLDFEGGSRNILSIDFEKIIEKTCEEAAAVFLWSHPLTQLVFEYANLPFIVNSWHELKIQDAEALLQQFNDNIKQAEEYYKVVLELRNGQHFPSGLIYHSKIVLIQNIIKKINELKADFQKQLKLMREVPESNNAAWNSFEEELKKQRIQLEIYQQQITHDFIGLIEVQIQTFVNKFQALSRVNKTFSQTLIINNALQKLEKVLADKKVGFKESQERLKAIQAIFEPVNKLATALLRDKKAFLVTQNITLEINQLYQEALRLFKQSIPNNVQNEALMQALHLAKAALENIRRAEVRIEKQQQDNLNGAQQTLAEAYQEFHALTEIMQKVKHLARSFKPIVKEEPKVDKPQVIHESPTLVWSEPKPTSPEITQLITDLRAMRNLLQKSKAEDPKKAVEELMIKIEAQIKTHSITASTLVELKKPLAEILYEWFSRNEGLYNRLCNLFNDNSSCHRVSKKSS